MASVWELYEYQPAFVLGFHGCDKSVGERILQGSAKHLAVSKNAWDWLGKGVYFWEGNPQRAMDWALDRKARGAIETPFVLGAIIDLKRCLNLLDSAGLQQVKAAHATLSHIHEMLEIPLPKNTGGKDNGARMLDCLVMNSLHDFRKSNELPGYNSVRGMFQEGAELYTGAGFKEKNHIQLCIRTKSCIKGYFRPIKGR